MTEPSKELIEKAVRAIESVHYIDSPLVRLANKMDAKAILSATIDDIRAQARAEALEEAAQAVESRSGLYQWPSEMSAYGSGYADSRLEAAKVVRSLPGRDQ